MKYIDTEKLIALIDAKLEDLGMSGSVWVGRSVLQELKDDIITSLQQERPEVDFETEYKSYMKSRKDDLFGNAVTVNMKDMARHFAKWGAEHLKIESGKPVVTST